MKQFDACDALSTTATLISVRVLGLQSRIKQKNLWSLHQQIACGHLVKHFDMDARWNVPRRVISRKLTGNLTVPTGGGRGIARSHGRRSAARAADAAGSRRVVRTCRYTGRGHPDIIPCDSSIGRGRNCNLKKTRETQHSIQFVNRLTAILQSRTHMCESARENVLACASANRYERDGKLLCTWHVAFVF